MEEWAYLLIKDIREKVVTRKFTPESFVKEFESDYRKYVTRLTLNRVLKIRA